MEIKTRFCIVIIVLLTWLTVQAQDPLRFEKEVKALTAADESVNREELILFTGSSSIRLWPNLAQSFPKHNVLNRGFGGSEMQDLYYYRQALILKYKPKQIFIYEGDNDLNAGKTPDQILATADSLLVAIRKELPEAKIIFIAAKPSEARWHLKDKYQAFNSELEQWTKSHKGVYFADVWTPMVNDNGMLPGLLMSDNLHMTEKGYTIWTAVLSRFL